MLESLVQLGAALAVLSAGALAQSDLVAMPSPPHWTCMIENHFDYVGYNIKNVRGNVDSCCSACQSTKFCMAWSWSDDTCWLKRDVKEVIFSPGVKSSVLLARPERVCKELTDMDFPGNDLARVDSVDFAGCCDLCHNYDGCRAYAWNNYLGGSCWLKSQATPNPVPMKGVKAALAYPEPYQPPMCETLKDYDYIGNDIGNRPASDPSDCCWICDNFAGCSAYTWTDHQRGTCWLKSQINGVVARQGAISGTTDIGLHCNSHGCRVCGSVENGVDYFDHDIGSTTSALAGCCPLCVRMNDCEAFSWSDYNGGTCWFKSGKNQTVVNPAVKSAQIMYILP